MIKKIIFLVGLTSASLFAQVQENIEVPYISYELKAGKGLDAVEANCLMCHSFGYILNQKKQSRHFWKAKIDKMITHFKAPITQESQKVILDYLFKHYGNGKEQ